jgi:sialidase-1
MKSLNVLEHITIHKDEKTYDGFPNIIITNNNKIIVAFRLAKDRQKETGKVFHNDITGKGVYVSSEDNGVTWLEEPKVIYDHPLGGMNDTNITLLSDGTILAVFYRWRGFMIEDVKDLKPWDTVIDNKYVWRLDGTYTLRSVDEGLSWDEPVKVDFKGNDMELHSRGKAVELSDKLMLLPLNGSGPSYRANPIESILAVSKDKGLNWEFYSTIAKSDTVDFYETTVYRTPKGKLVAFIRGICREYKSDCGLYYCESYDNGLTWNEVKRASFEVSSTVFDVITLNDGNALLTYGYRKEPYGIRARILNSECTYYKTGNSFQIPDVRQGKLLNA